MTSTELDLAWVHPRLGGLARRDTTGLGSGLSRAVADRLGFDVALVRMAFIVLTFGAGFGAALYGWGTLLTAGPTGRRPIDSLLPSFRTWSVGAQKFVVIGSTVALVALVSSVTSFPWVLAVIAVIALSLLRRRGRGGSVAPAADLTTTLDDDQLIDAWRRDMARAAGARSMPRPTPAPSRPTEVVTASPAIAVPKAWGWAVAIPLIGAAAGVATWVLVGSAVTALAAATALTGLGAIGHAVLRDSRRLPRAFLWFLAVLLASTGWLAAKTAGAPLSDAEIGPHSVTRIASDETVDLTALVADPGVEVRVVVVGSDVDILVPGSVSDLRVSSVASDVRRQAGPATDVEWPHELIIDATAARVTIVEGARS